MKYKFYFQDLLLCVLLVSLIDCTDGILKQVDEKEIASHFDDFRAIGTIVISSEKTGETLIYNEARAKTGFLPASTYKIFNSMVALETKVITVDDAIKWDGVVRSVPAWNQDQRMREAFQRSTVWYYQNLARRIGYQRMKSSVVREKYGNQNIEGGIDQFWLTGSLRISALEQIELLRNLKQRRLGFSTSVMNQVVDLLTLEKCSNYVLKGKTGWVPTQAKQLGWLVGWVELGSDTYFYAMNLESNDPKFPMVEARQKIVRATLKDTGILSDTCR